MSEVWWNWWQSGGAVVYQKSYRIAALSFPRVGWRRGLFVVGVYAPTSSSGKEERNTLRNDLDLVLEFTPATSLTVIMGDFNAEMGNNVDQSIGGWDVMGRFSAPKITTPGQEWRDWCSRQGFRDVASRFQCRNRVSWVHPRFLSHHELDHVFVKGSDVWHLQQCRFLVEGPNVEFPWSPYTDHNPVELILKIGKQWCPSMSFEARTQTPDIARMRGTTPEATALRREWMDKVETRLQSLMDQPHWETICQICRGVALEVCGILKLHKGAPWLRYHGNVIKQLDQAIRQAQEADRQARHTGDPQRMQQCRRQLNTARRDKLQQIRTWETEWLSQKAEEANRTLDTPAATNIFQLVKELISAVGKGSRDGGQAHAGSPAEVEAWKDHFQAIQQGIGEVDDSIWPDISQRPIDTSLDDPPSWEEFLRAIKEMRLGKAGGEDTMLAEYIKFGGPQLRKEVYRIVQECWQSATTAPPGKEAENWPTEWKVGITVPLWKRKQPMSNKHNWRGITLLSVGSKLVARICAARLQRWSQPWLNSCQFGFKAGSGVDDVHQVTRRLLEEAAQSVHPHTIMFKFFDLEKAYPKVPRHALWKILELKGCPPLFRKVLQAIHNGTHTKIRFQGFVSTSFVPDRGLREGCPSSPIMFNLFHDSLMEVYRVRRLRVATAHECQPGISITYKVDGRIAKRRGDRNEEGRNIKMSRIGDFAYADDTAIIGDAEEIRHAEPLFVNTVSHFAGRVNEHKTEGLRVCDTAHAPYDVQGPGEASTVKHVGAILAERAGHTADTDRAVRQGVQRVEQVASAWSRRRQVHPWKRSQVVGSDSRFESYSQRCALHFCAYTSMAGKSNSQVAISHQFSGATCLQYAYIHTSTARTQ